MQARSSICVFVACLCLWSHAMAKEIPKSPVSIIGKETLIGDRATPPPPATMLQCAYLTSPIGIDMPQPRLSWYLSHVDRAQGQSAYQVQVGTAPNFGAGTIVWDSGKVASAIPATTLGFNNAPKALVSDTSYFWRVMWWDLNSQSAPWASSNFDTGLTNQSDWMGKWTGGAGNILRQVFTLPANPIRARAFISGLGYYELYLNGQRVGDYRLDPGWTTYNKRVLYNVYDVTSLLQRGNNAIGVMLGHGWYSSTETREPNGPLSLLFQLSVDGKIYATSGPSWNISQGPIIYDGIYNGETYDARLEQQGWNMANFTVNSRWTAAQQVVSPGGVLSYQMIPPVRITTDIKAIGITNPAPSTYVVDFGQNFSGWCKVTITGPAGANITLLHAEVMQHNGTGLVYTANLRSAKATDVYILKGDKNGEVYEPHFTYHGFRYVQITATAFVPTLSTLVGRHLHSDVGQTGNIQFQASSDILNKIQHNTLWGQASNLMSVPTDCDQRDERKGWMGDAQLSAEEALHNFYMPAFYTHFLKLIHDDQGPDGSLTDTVPFTFGSRPADPAWGSAYPSILYWLWQHYNDLDVVKHHYQSVKAYINFLTAQIQITGLAKMYYNYGDWVPPPPEDMCSQHLTSAFSYIANLQQFVQLAAAVGNTADVNAYSAMIATASSQFNAAFLKPTNVYDNGDQTATALPLWLGIIPTANHPAVVNNFLNDIVSKHDTHLTTGIIGAKYMMEALHLLGRDDIALQLAENIDYPSWGYMAVNPVEPATTLWELWDSPSEGPGMDSRSHIMFGSVSDWFYKAMGGVDVGTSNHFDTINIKPSIVGDIKSVSSYFTTGQGNISTSFTLIGGTTVCATGAEAQPITLDCGSIGSTGVISEIKFANFGLPRGQCGNFGENKKCSAAGVHDYVHNSCVGKKSCSLIATHTALGVQKPCADFSRMYVEAVCSQPMATYGYTLTASIPVGATATISFPKLDLANPAITEAGKAVWTNGLYQGGVAGISGAKLVGNYVQATVGSGQYNFQLSSPSKGVSVCGAAPEQNNVGLTCPTSKTITYIRFASFGDPEGTCGNFTIGNCNAGSSLTVVSQYCLYRNSCSIPVAFTTFGDPCDHVPKILAVEAICD